MSEREQITDSMFQWLDRKLPPELKAKFEAGSLRELLLVLADWVYLERFKAVTDFTTEMTKGNTGALAKAREQAQLVAAIERGREAAEKVTFLDALGEIR